MTTKSLCHQSPNEDKTLVMDDIIKELPWKVLEIPLFTGIQLQRLNFDVAIVCHRACTMMQGKVQLLANVAMKEKKDNIQA